MVLLRKELRVELGNGERPYYSTLDEISGRVVFAPLGKVEVTDVVIDFVGVAKTWIDPTNPGVLPRKASLQVHISMEETVLS
jgi:hypothetical protein